MQGYMVKHQGWSGGRRSKGKARAKASIVVFQGREWKRQGKQLSRLRIC